MELSGTLLVAIMFSTVVGLSIGGLLINLAGTINAGFRFSTSKLFFGWAIYLLLLHLSLFWDTSAITRFDDWEFGGFLVIVAGPMLLLLTTQILISDADPEQLDEHYEAVARKFQISFAFLHAWIILALLLISTEPALYIVRSLLLIGVSTICAIVSSRRIQGWLCGVAWVLTLIPVFVD